jgi:hypothetical protein
VPEPCLGTLRRALQLAQAARPDRPAGVRLGPQQVAALAPVTGFEPQVVDVSGQCAPFVPVVDDAKEEGQPPERSVS